MMRLIALLISVYVFPNIALAKYTHGIDKLIFNKHIIEVDAVNRALMLNPLNRDYAHEVMSVTTPHGDSHLLRVNKNGYETRSYIVDELSDFSPEIMDLIYILYPEDLRSDKKEDLSPNFAVACISKFKLNNNLISVRCYRSYRAIESMQGMVDAKSKNGF